MIEIRELTFRELIFGQAEIVNGGIFKWIASTIGGGVLYDTLIGVGEFYAGNPEDGAALLSDRSMHM